MTPPAWREEAIGRHHRRREFDCGVRELNDYLALHARRNHARGLTATFVAVRDADPTWVLGYYSLSNAHIAFSRAPASITAGFPAYPLPAVRLARLAVDLSCQRQGLGRQLLLCAGERALAITQQSGVVVLLIDAKDENAARFYRANDGIPLLDDPLQLVIPLDSIRKTIDEVRRGR